MFSRACIEALRTLPFMPGEDCLIVANDWHTAPVPVLLKEEYQPRGEFLNTKVGVPPGVRVWVCGGVGGQHACIGLGVERQRLGGTPSCASHLTLHPTCTQHPSEQTALCIHNIAFQGRFWPDEFAGLGLPPSSAELFEFTDGLPKVYDERAPADESAKLPEVCWLKIVWMTGCTWCGGWVGE